jgi:hypothetical protein
MRLLAFLFVTGSFAVVGCAGDSSAIMSVWNDSGVGGVQPPAGGAGGQGGPTGGTTTASGGSSGGGSIVVSGGVRDLATAQCTSTTGGACMFSSDYLACLRGNCGQKLGACYSQPGTSTSAAGGVCLKYANCLLGCPCDASKSTCESNCGQNYLSTDYNCEMCIYNLGSCASTFNCTSTTSCGVGLGLP